MISGISVQVEQEIDAYGVTEMRNMLFGRDRGLDLFSLDIFRGRDHGWKLFCNLKGLGSYNDVREAMGLGRKSSFAEVTRDEEVRHFEIIFISV